MGRAEGACPAWVQLDTLAQYNAGFSKNGAFAHPPQKKTARDGRRKHPPSSWNAVVRATVD